MAGPTRRCRVRWWLRHDEDKLLAVAAFSAIAILAFGVAAYLGLGHIQGPLPNMVSDLPAVTFATVAGAGLIDGINPCAFTVLLLFITALLATVQARGTQTIPVKSEALDRARVDLYRRHLSHLIRRWAPGYWPRPVFLPAITSALVWALWQPFCSGFSMLKDYFLPGWGPSLHVPPVVSRISYERRRSA